MGQNNKRSSKVFVAEENLLFRRGLSTLFSSDPTFQLAGEASTVANLLTELRDLRPHVLVIDAGMLVRAEPLRLGLTLRQFHSDTRILVLAHQDDEDTMAAAIACGAKGLVLKASGPAQLLAALQNVAFSEGGMNLSGLLPEFQALAAHTPPAPGNSVLTAREQEVMKLLAEGKTVRRVAHDLSLSMKTIEAHKLNLMRKLDIHDRATLIAYVQRDAVRAEALVCSRP